MIKKTYDIEINDKINLEIRCSLNHHQKHIIAINVMGFSKDGKKLFFKYDPDTGDDVVRCVNENEIVSISKRQ